MAFLGSIGKFLFGDPERVCLSFTAKQFRAIGDTLPEPFKSDFYILALDTEKSGHALKIVAKP